MNVQLPGYCVSSVSPGSGFILPPRELANNSSSIDISYSWVSTCYHANKTLQAVRAAQLSAT